MRNLLVACQLLAVGALLSIPVFAGEEASLKWTIKKLTVDANEGVAVGDINKDGKMDVVAGRNWYAGPDYLPRPLRTIEDANGYVLSNGDEVYDLNGDGWLDVLAGSFTITEVYWYENPGAAALEAGLLWKKHLLVDTETNRNEGQILHDLNGDGVPEWVVNSWGKDVPTLAWQFASEKRQVEQRKGKKTVTVEAVMPTMKKVVIGSKINGHGIGFGDLNGDGREDLFFEGGWYERPAGDPMTQEWIIHQDWSIHASLPVQVRDLNKDGRNDIIIGMGHDYGLFWWEQKQPASDGTLTWEKHLIDDKFSQPHCVRMVDLDGDGEEELVTAKRVFGHNGNDPGGKEPPCMYYYDWDASSLKFQRHTINEGQVGGGLQFRTVDLNGDGRMDIATAGKSGTYVLINEGR